MFDNDNAGSYKNGTLPGDTAPLAMAYVPMQKSANPAYETAEALSRGTLFPGLDLPFINIVNDTKKLTPITELMAIDFIVDELELYLDSHQNDKEAFAMYQTFLALAKEARERYVKKYGPVTQSDMLGMNSYCWLNDPWPWDYRPKMEV